MSPVLVAVLASFAACTVGIAALAFGLGLGRLAAAVWALIATAALAALAVGGLYALLFECLEIDTLQWRWSPRRELCEKEGSPAMLGGFALLAVPPLATGLAVRLWSRGRRGPAFLALLALVAIVVPFLPALYIQALPSYSRETTPALHDPYLRVDTDERPVRACYVLGITYGPDRIEPTDDTERVCVDLADTYEAGRLTPEDDQGITSGALYGLGLKLTENGMDAGTEWEGLVVERVYRLPGNEARAGASLITP